HLDAVIRQIQRHLLVGAMSGILSRGVMEAVLQPKLAGDARQGPTDEIGPENLRLHPNLVFRRKMLIEDPVHHGLQRRLMIELLYERQRAPGNPVSDPEVER